MSNDTVPASLKQKIDELNQQAWEARVNDSPKAFTLSQESIELARSINYSKGLAEGLRSLGFGYIRLFKNDEAAPLLREALTLFQSLNDLTGQAIVYEYLGIIERNWGNLGRSLELLLKGNELVRQANDSTEIEVTSCYQIGVTYKHLGNHENALDYLYRALSLAKKTEFTLMESYAINIIGSIYFDNGDYEQALDCYQKGLVIRRESHDKWGEAGSLDNIGFTYLKLNELEKAIDYCTQSLGISRDNGDKKGEANALLHLAEIYGRAGDVTRASKFSHESLEIRTARGDKRGEAEVLLFLADLHKKKGEIEDQYNFEWISRALKIADEIKAQDLLSKANYNLHEYHNQKGNYREALAQLNAHLKIEKELHKNTINQKVTNLEITHKAEAISQRNKELTELNEQIEKANAELRIESSLERVRARTMAMHQSEELMDVVRLVYEEFEKLQINNESTDIEVGLIDEETGVASMWAHFYKSDGTISTFKFPFNHFPVVREEYKIWKATSPEKRKQLFFTAEISGERVKEFLDLSDELPELAEIFKPLKDAGITKWVTHNAYFSHGVLTLQGTEAYSPATLDILKRLAVVFEQTYIRFLDLKRAEAQAREARIEAALERVRSRSMAMHKSDELLEVVASVFQQMQLLGFNLNLCNIVLFDSKTLGADYWASASEQAVLPEGYHVPYADHPFYHYQLNTWKNAEPFAMFELSGELKNSWDDILFTKTDLQKLPVSTKKMMQQLDKVIISSVATKHGLVQAIGTEQLSNDDISVLSRFAKVFEQTYTRFLDLQKAEAQARESQIEAALERVRSRTMGMQRSDELPEAANLLFRQIESLGIHVFSTGYNIWQEGKKAVTSWMSSQGLIQQPFSLPLTEEPALAECYEAAIRGDTFYVQELSGDKLISHLSYMRALPGVGELMGQMSEAGISLPNRMLNHHAFFLQGYLLFITYDPVPEAHEIFRRFAKVFEQTYTRFLDLQKAEAQAREAQIEASLERVRSRTMAMHKSDEVMDVAGTLFDELQKLGFNFGASSIIIMDKQTGDAEYWIAGFTKNRFPESYQVKYFTHPYHDALLSSWKKGEKFLVYKLEGKDKRTYDDVLFTRTGYKNIPGQEQELMRGIDSVTFSIAFMKHGALHWGPAPVTDEQAIILQRFSNVFEQSYTRFLDLQNAEAQAREAQIEAALERVRAKVMAMTSSADLNATSLVFGDQLRKLGIDWQFSYFWLIEEEKNENTFWITWPDNKTSITIYTLEEAEQYFNECLISWRAGIKIHDNYVPPSAVQAWLDTFQRIADDAGGVARQIMTSQTFGNGVFYYDAMMKYGSFGICINQPATNEEKNIQCRFAIEFERAYTRFLDLKKAEAQTREALIEGALERVRARALAMQQPEELKDVAQVLRNEMGALGVEELETCSIYIHGESSEDVECWYALQDPKQAEKKMVSDHFVLNLNDTWVGREMQRFYDSGEKQTSIVMQGENRKEWIGYCYKHSPAFTGFYGETIPDRTYHLHKFSHGYIGAAAPGDISYESWKLLARAASVFSLAYSRFKDLTQARIDLMKLKEEKKRAEDALTELQNAQKQLIQTEKMASLGELTAGIAHEIQNPLNFVNNFSDVSNELIEEMKEELANGNIQQAMIIANDVKDNLDKILHHGKRADGIVKGMLQHSRSSSGMKQPTDINNLADEYLRLAYHGFRAKDKSFSAKYETSFDRRIEKINVVPQEIGRVILNLINNAFYTVNEKKKQVDNGYEAIVTVSTKKIKDKIEISVKDNGNGIPKKVLDKIFQPFFTTKPTGEGTGLGLSLSYDIITKGHGGEIKVRTDEGMGAEFIISLPVN